MNLPSLPAMPWGQDKSWHFLTGLPGGSAVALVARHYASPHVFLWGLGIGAAVGAGKEAWDWWSNQKALKAGLPPPHSLELWDAVATTLGFSAGSLFILSIN
jgi:hypothetical protein